MHSKVFMNITHQLHLHLPIIQQFLRFSNRFIKINQKYIADKSPNQLVADFIRNFDINY